MPLLETLPAHVEARLKELRANRGEGSPWEPAARAMLPSGSAASDELSPAPSPEGDGAAAPEEAPPEEAPSEEGNGARRLVFATDIEDSGRFEPEWLVVDHGHVYVLSDGDGKHVDVRHSVPLGSIREATADMLVGNGLLRVRTPDETVTLLRYSQAAAAEANAVARQINLMAKGEPPRWEQVESRKRLCPRCKRVLPDHTDVCPGCVDRRAVMLRLFRFLKPYKLYAAASVAVIFGVSLVELAPPYIGGRIVDLIVRANQTGSRDMTPIAWFVLFFIATRLAAAGLAYCQRRLNSFLGARVLMDIRLAMFDKLSTLSLSFYDRRTIGSVMSRVTNDADHLWDFLTDGIPWLMSTLLALIGTSVVLFGMNWRLALILLTPGIFVFALNRWFMPRARGKWRHVWRRISRMYSSLGTALNGMRVVKAFAQEDREVSLFRDRNMQVFSASYAANAMWAIYWPILGLLMSSGYVILWLYGGSQVLGRVMTVGTLTAFAGYLMRFYSPFQDFGRVIDWSTRSLTAADRVFEVLDTEAEIQEAPEPRALPAMRGAVEFRDVSFSYDGARRVLEDFSLKVDAGEMIGLVGHSGAGKSTIINLLARFYDVTEGAILVDGVDLRDLRRHDFRSQIGIVLQEPFLFPGTIRENIAYAKPDAGVEEILRAAKAANCHEFILKFPDGYDTQVGERGQRLSGGERQRISIARAILHDPRILILDEATASVDTETEKQIQEAIQRLVRNRTTFAIAHRLSTLRHATRLVVMQEGRLAECGTHDELMDLDGVYAGLVKIQTEVNRIRAI
ncbi:MAG: ABC transporter ATP-binding protein [Chthonomonadales bacterium]|nr:ABC transporter ATP-binding protein [Chthonomonadales bacterium]